MKRVIVFLIIFLCIISCSCAEEISTPIIVNGVKITMTDGEKIVKPVSIDGEIYVPLKAFLDAVNISYSEEDGSYIITMGANEVKEAKVDYYSQLSEGEKKFLDNFLCGVSSFKNPSSIRLISIYNDDLLPNLMYFVELSAQNGFGGNSIKRYACMFEVVEEAKNEKYFNEHKVDTDYDIALLNKALTQKLEENGY